LLFWIHQTDNFFFRSSINKLILASTSLDESSDEAICPSTALWRADLMLFPFGAVGLPLSDASDTCCVTFFVISEQDVIH